MNTRIKYLTARRKDLLYALSDSTLSLDEHVEILIKIDNINKELADEKIQLLRAH